MGIRNQLVHVDASFQFAVVAWHVRQLTSALTCHLCPIRPTSSMLIFFGCLVCKFRYHVTPEKALKLFAQQRSFDKHHLQARVSNPSQRRFVHYAREMSRGRLLVSPRRRGIVVTRVHLRSRSMPYRCSQLLVKLSAVGRVTPVATTTVRDWLFDCLVFCTLVLHQPPLSRKERNVTN